MTKINWKYALGEILIVIIGITIAFSLNKCSENQNDKELKIAYLNNLKEDIKTDKKALEDNLVTLKEFQEAAKEIAPYLNTDSDKKMTIIRKIFKISELIAFIPQDITYQTLINSGDLTLFKQLELKSSIQKYYSSDLHTVLKAYERQEIIHTTYLGKYYIYHSDFDKLSRNQFPFEDEKLLKRIIQSLHSSYSIQIEATQKGILQCDHMITLLLKEIEKNTGK